MSGVADREIRRHRLTVEDYHRMGEVGILSEDARVELIEGELIDMAPIGSQHAGTVSALTDVFTSALHGRAIVAVQSPVTLDDQSEPQSDLAILKFRGDYYRAAHPGSADVLLLIEVADTSAAYDRGIKVELYARYGIPEVWLVDLSQRCGWRSTTVLRLVSTGMWMTTTPVPSRPRRLATWP